MSIYTLNPEHCYGFAESLAKNCSDPDMHNKCNIMIREGHIHIASTERRQFNKRLSKRHNLNHFNASRTPPMRLKNEALHGGGSLSPLLQHHPKSAPSLLPRPRTFSFEDIIAEDVFQKEPYGQDCSSPAACSSPYVSVLTPATCPERRMIPCTTVFEFSNNTPAGMSHSMKTVHENYFQNVPVTIPLHDVAYCVAVPSNQRIFLLTSRQGTCLVCRVYLFHRREKAQALTLALAKQFEKSYMEWQKMKQVKRKQSLVKAIEKSVGKNASTVGSKVIEQNNNVMDAIIIDDANKENHRDTDSSPEESSDVEVNDTITVEMSREFTRRASCLDRPERLELGDGMTIEKLEKNCENMVLSSDGFTTDEERDSDESPEHGVCESGEEKSDTLRTS